MAEPTYIFRFIGDFFSDETANYVSNSANQLASDLTPVAIAAVTLWICVYGTLTILGKIAQPFGDFITKAIKISLICAVALNYGNYSSYVVGSIEGVENAVSSALSGGSTPSPEGIYGTLDAAMGNGIETAKKFFEFSAKYNFLTQTAKVVGGQAAGVITYLGVVLFFMVGGASIILAKFMLTLTFAVGPIFILCLLFPATAGFFDRWIAQAVTYTLNVVFIAATLGVALSVFNGFLGKIQHNYSDPLFVAIQLVAVLCVLCVVTMKITELAAGLAGGAGAAMVSARQLIGVVGGGATVVAAPPKAAASAAVSGAKLGLRAMALYKMSQSIGKAR